MSFEVEVDDILRELLREPGVLAAELVSAGEPGSPPAFDGARLHREPLGHGAELLVTLASDAPQSHSAIVRASREIRACARIHGVSELPSLSLVGRAPRSRAALLARMTRLLDALAAQHGATGVAMSRGGRIVATGGALDDEQRERVPFLRRRLVAEATRLRGRTSHAEVFGDDVYACSFWFDAFLFVFLRPGEWSVDFVRHRARAATRALAAILPHLDDDPPEPARLMPVPPRPER